MTRTQFKGRFRQLRRSFARELEREALRLFESGGVDADGFGDDFCLAKIVLYAAADKAAACFRPLAPENKALVENLKRM